MASNFGATFVPGGLDDYYMPEVVAPSPQRVTPQVPQNMQDDLQRMELEAREVGSRDTDGSNIRHDRAPSLSTYLGTKPDVPDKTVESFQHQHNVQPPPPSQTAPHPVAADDTTGDVRPYQNHNESRTEHLDNMRFDAPSFSPFPKVTGDNVPPADDAKEEILWNARKHVLQSQNVDMQITWARDVLIWAEIAMDAVARESSERPRPATPRIEHELRMDALNIVNYLAGQEHPEALYMRSKWLEFGKFGNRVDKREAYSGYKRAAELGNARSEYRMGMLFEQSNDMSKAKEHYYRGLSLKDSAALYRMGMMGLLGQHGESKDYQGGLERIRLAADGADEDAPQGAYVYGMLLGRDLPDISIPDALLPYNVDSAKMYVEKAAYLGFAKAQLKMGQAFELCQFGCEFNPSYSLHYYGLAAKQGLPEAALGVSRWFLFGYDGVFKKNEELAYKYAQEAAAEKLSTGEFAMGYYHEIGIHVNKSITEARRWYQLAAEHGNKDAAGRLESLSEDKSLSKQDHETTTLTRIKSQHGSQRGGRPDRFKQPQTMPTLGERSGPPTPVDDGSGWSSNNPAVTNATVATPPLRISPHHSPRIPPSSHADFPDPSRASAVGLPLSSDRAPAFNIRLDGDAQAIRPQSAAPYPVDDRPAPLNLSRPKSTAPYPEDDVQGPPRPQPNQGLGLAQGPLSDRPTSAFGIKSHTNGPRPMPASYSTGSLQLPMHPAGARGRVQSAGWEPQGQSGYRQPSPGLSVQAGKQPYPNEGPQGRLLGSQPYPGGGPPPQNRLPMKPAPIPSQGPPPGGPPPGGRDYNARTSSRPISEAPQPGMKSPPSNYERFSRIPGAGDRPERLSSIPVQDPRLQQRVSTGLDQGPSNSPRPMGPGRLGSAPPLQPPSKFQDQRKPSPSPSAAQASAPAPAKSGKGPATFEDMGIPQGKQEGDCVVM